MRKSRFSEEQIIGILRQQLAERPAPAPAAEPESAETAGLSALERLRQHRKDALAALPALPGEIAATLVRPAAEVSNLGLVFLVPLVVAWRWPTRGRRRSQRHTERRANHPRHCPRPRALCPLAAGDDADLL